MASPFQHSSLGLLSPALPILRRSEILREGSVPLLSHFVPNKVSCLVQHAESSVGGNSTAEYACIRDIVENFITYVTEELVVTFDHQKGCPWIRKKGQSIKKRTLEMGPIQSITGSGSDITIIYSLEIRHQTDPHC